MRPLRDTLAGSLVAGAVCLLLGSPALAASTAGQNVYSFDLVTPNTAVSPSGGTISSGGMTMTVSPGDWISVTGSGIFDPRARSVVGKGTFTHYDRSGTAVCHGTWRATTFESFIDLGTNADGEEGGVLSLLVTHYCQTTVMIMAGIPMTVTSTVKAPAGSNYVEGTTQCMFTQKTGGSVVMQPQQ